MKTEKRSKKQHGAEWTYYRIIAGATGHTPYEVYEILTARFLLEENEKGQRVIKRPRSLSPIEHNDYMEQIRVLMAEHRIILPDPNEIDSIDPYEYKLHD